MTSEAVFSQYIYLTFPSTCSEGIMKIIKLPMVDLGFNIIFFT